MTLLVHCGSDGDMVQSLVTSIAIIVNRNARKRKKKSKLEKLQHLKCEDIKTIFDPQGW